MSLFPSGWLSLAARSLSTATKSKFKVLIASPSLNDWLSLAARMSSEITNLEFLMVFASPYLSSWSILAVRMSSTVKIVPPFASSWSA